VAASTSNIGPGFDFIGLALSLFLEVEARPCPGPEHTLELAGAAVDWPAAADNLLIVAFERAWKAAGGGEQRFAFRAWSEIPLSRGFGSSGAAVVAGSLLAGALAPRKLERDELLRLAVEIEGHPDNVSPALLGGCVLALARQGAAPRIVRQALHPSLAFAVAWPSVGLETRFARSILPVQVAFTEAVDNPRRLALLLEGLRTGERDLLELGGVDHLHVPYRLPHIPGGERALDAARAAGAHLATISGSGSGLFFVAPRKHIERVARAARAELERASPPAVARVVEAVTDAAMATPI
jgi:homoserine kinase